MKKLALEYLAAAYGSDKLNDPAKAEPVYQQIIQMEPNEPANYVPLAKLYEDAGRYDEAEAQLVKARDQKPNDPAVYTNLAAYYNRQGDFPKTIEALQKAADLDPNNPEGYHLIATLLLGQGSKGLPPVPRRAEGLHPEGARDGGQGAQPQPGVHGGDDLQEHPAPHGSEHREGQEKAGRAPQGGRRAPQQGDGAPEEEGLVRGRSTGAEPGLAAYVAADNLGSVEKGAAPGEGAALLILYAEPVERPRLNRRSSCRPWPAPAGGFLAHAVRDDADLLDAGALGGVDDGDDVAVAQRAGRR